jgi:hypothetical protein
VNEKGGEGGVRGEERRGKDGGEGGETRYGKYRSEVGGGTEREAENSKVCLCFQPSLLPVKFQDKTQPLTTTLLLFHQQRI